MIYTKIIPIENNVDYTPGLKEIRQHERPIMGIHVVRELTSNVKIYFLGEPSDPIEFSPISFVPGGIYPYAIAKVIFSSTKDIGAFYGCIEKYI
jgi:hypothetical protein